MLDVPFDLQVRTRFVFGNGVLQQLGQLAAPLGSRALVVSDAGVVAAGHTQRGIAALEQEGIEVRLFCDLHENPTTEDVERGVELARDFRPDLLVGLGGGSSMDCAKGINFIFTGGGKMEDYWGEGKAVHPMLPMIAVPTTAGTGSESQSFALISDSKTHVKMACGDPKAAFRLAVLDPSLTLTQPPLVTALTGIDALSHALETFVTRRRNAASMTFSRQAWQWLVEMLPRVVAEPGDLEARAGMQLGACLAGLAIENSMLGAAHALANPLTARYGTVHGQAVAVMLPHVLRWNAADPEADRAYGLLLRSWPGAQEGDGRSAGRALADRLEELLLQVGLKNRLGDLGVPAGQLEMLARDAARQWTGTFNPRALTERDYLMLYRQAL